jgi:uncharacterized protein YeaO (DUF488 family)
MITIKRAYEPAAPEDGTRILVDRLWPRGVRTASARVDRWAKELAPSDALRRWFGHDPARFSEFRSRYLAELRTAPARATLAELAKLAARERVTLVYGARDPEHNNAVVLASVLRARSRRRGKASHTRARAPGSPA